MKKRIILLFRLFLNHLFSFMELLTTLIFRNNSFLRKKYILINNYLVKKSVNKNIQRTLLLLPHCLQNNLCDIRITNDINNCKLCRKCKISKIIDLTQDKKINVSVATGGTIARKIILETQPEIIFASACERDLVQGIKDAFPYKVFGILNLLPNGPCFNTDISLKELELTFKQFFCRSKK